MWRIRLLVFLYFLAVAALVGWLLWPLHAANALPFPPWPAHTPEPPDLQETLVLGPTVYAPDAPGALRVVVYDPRDGAPIADADVRLFLAPVGRPDDADLLATARTNALGTAPLTFRLPDVSGGQWALVVKVDGPVGQQQLVRSVTVRRHYVAELTSDKALYRPGETIHARLLLRDKLTALPVSGRPVTFTFTDSRGNRICTLLKRTGSWGVAYADCELAERVISGEYRLRAVITGDAVAGRVVMVSDRRSDFPVRLSADSRWRRVEVRAAYPWGEPLAGARVEVRGLLDDGHEAVRRQGRLDDAGELAVTLPISRSLRLIARVRDERGRTGWGETWMPFARTPFTVTAIPESGVLKPGIENVVYLYAAYPEGTPAYCTFDVVLPDGRSVQVQGSPDAPAQVSFTPVATVPISLAIAARDATGEEVTTQLSLPLEVGDRHLLLRPVRRSYRVGERVRLLALAPRAAGPVYLDVARDGQLTDVRAAAPVEGVAAFDLPADHPGRLDLYAYYLANDGTVVGDAQSVRIVPSHTLRISLFDTYSTSQDVPRRLMLRVTDERGQGVRSSLDVGVVAERDIVFLPSAAQIITPPITGDWQPRRMGVVSKPRPTPEPVRRAFALVAQARAARKSAFTAVGERAAWGWAGLAGLVWMVATIGAWRGRGRRGLSLAGRDALTAVLLLPFMVGGAALLAYWGWMMLGPGAVVALGLSWFGILTLLAAGIVEDSDPLMAVLFISLLGLLALGAGISYAASRGAALPIRRLLVGLALVALALYVAGADQARRGRSGIAVGTFALIALFLVTPAGALLANGNSVPVADTPPPVSPVPTPTPAPATWPLTVTLPVPPPSATSPRPGVAGETLCWLAGSLTDEHGFLELKVPSTDPWWPLHVRVNARASRGADGELAGRLLNYCPLTVEPELPSALTVGDELKLPVTIYNATPVSRTAQVTATLAPWFRLRKRGADVQQVELPPHGTGTVYLPLRVREWGRHALTLTVRSGDVHITTVHKTRVRPNARLITRSYGGQVADSVRYRFRVPWSALRGSDRVTVTLYPGLSSVLAEALSTDLPAGATFDQMAARMEVGLLRAAYLRRSGRWTWHAQQQAHRTCGLDYQRLLTTVDEEGGFSPFDRLPADIYRTARGLMCLNGGRELYRIDPAVIRRAARWLLYAQSPEGTWRGRSLPVTWRDLPRPELPFTAYAVWALAEAGYADEPEVQVASEHLERYLDKAQDPYTLAMSLNALLTCYRRFQKDPGRQFTDALSRLAAMAEVEDGEALWRDERETFDGARGEVADIERTALAVGALLRADAHLDVAAQGVAALLANRDPSGGWGSPTATALALRALLMAWEREEPSAQATTVRMSVNEVVSGPLRLHTGTDEEAQCLSVGDLEKGYNYIRVQVGGGDEVTYRIVGRYFLPWSRIPSPQSDEEPVSVEIGYERTSLTVGETLTVTVGVVANREEEVQTAVVEVGLPPGLDVIARDWEELLAKGVIAGYERDGGWMRVYLSGLESGQAVRFAFRLRAVYPLSVHTFPTIAFDVANPQQLAVRAPVKIEVQDR